MSARVLPPLDLLGPAADAGALRALLAAPEFVGAPGALKVVLGRNADALPCVADLAALPHLLVGGGQPADQGRLLEVLLTTLLLGSTPRDLALVLVGRRGDAFRGFAGVPHLLAPVIEGPFWGVEALLWTRQEMDRRYAVLARAGVRTIDRFNEGVAGRQADRPRSGGEGTEAPASLPRIVFVIEDLRDLIPCGKAHVEETLHELGILARVAGIHLVVATSDLSPVGLPGLVSVALTARVCLRVARRFDSHVVLHAGGADELEPGECLYLAPNEKQARRLRVPTIAAADVARVTDYWRHAWPAASS